MGRRSRPYGRTAPDRMRVGTVRSRSVWARMGAAIVKWGESCDADNESELAKKLFEDFERFGVLEDRGDSAASTTAQDCGGELAEGLEVEALVAPDDADVGAVEELVEDDELGMD